MIFEQEKPAPDLRVADMHTHSEASHDSNCKISDMRDAQAARGTSLFAVTDHFDTYSYESYDIFTPIKRAAEDAARLNSESTAGPTVLRGMEISEGFWYPEIYEKTKGIAELDVIIGSVHCARYGSHTAAYSQIDFSKFSEEEIKEYLAAYFNDVNALIELCDFDILAHLTCPLRYIVGRYERAVDLKEFSEQIDGILRAIIHRGIALELNTSSFDTLGDWMPPRWVLRRYRDMGGEVITLGSDAHIPENASLHFEKAIGDLLDIGFTNVYYYKQRQAYKIALK